MQNFRIFSRTLPLPFQKRQGRQSISERLDGRRIFEEALTESPKSIGVIIKLHEQFLKMTKDPLFKEIESFVQPLGLDVRSEANYAVLLYSTGKVCT